MPVETTPAFLIKVKQHTKMLEEIDSVTKSLQYKEHTLAACRGDLDELISDVSNEKTERGSPFYGFKLGTHYIGRFAEIVKYKLFESAVEKIQLGKHSELSTQEKLTVRKLLKCTVSTENECDSSTGRISMSERLIKRRKTCNLDNPYINCDFILGSVAEVERIWRQIHRARP